MCYRIAAVLTILVAASANAETTELSLLKARRYVIRSAVGTTERIFQADGGAGLWSWEPSSNTWSRLRPLVVAEAANGNGAALAATEDRIILQGTTFLEFDAATNRLLRAYPALGPEYRGWGYHGPYISNATAQSLGVEPGYYGFAYCPPRASSFGATCSPADFPGRAGAQADIGNLLYHRDLHTPTLTLKKQLRIGPYALPEVERRHVTLDVGRARLWTRHAYPIPGAVEHTLGYLTLGPGISDEVVLETRNPGSSNAVPLATLYDAVDDALLTAWRSEGEPFHVTRRRADLSTDEHRVFTASNPPWGLPLAMTSLAPGIPSSYEQVVPVVGKGPGALGTYWRSDVWFYNPSSATTTISVRRVASPQTTRVIEMPPRASLQMLDVLGMLGGGPAEEGGDGINTDALVISSPYRWGEQVTIYSRTYTGGASGSYGQAVPAVPSRTGYSTHTYDVNKRFDTTALAPEFFLDLREQGQFRHNLGVVNDENDPLRIDLFYGVALAPPSPNEPPTTSITIPAHSVANISLEALLATAMGPDRPSMVKIAGSRPAPLWLSMVDNKTGDGTFLPFATFGLLGARDATVAIPQVARTRGANGTFWRSDLYGFFHPPASSYEQLPSVTFYPGSAAQCGTAIVAATLAGPSGQPGVAAIDTSPSIYRRVFPDVVGQLPCAEGTMGALEMSVGSWMAGFTRTYTTRADGGTYGDILPFYPSGGWPVQHFSGITINDDVRINLGLYNGLEYAVTHRLLIYDAAGNEVRREEVTIEPRRSVQASLATFVGELPQGLHSMTVLPLDKEGEPGRSWAYVAIVDNATGDTTNLW